MRTRGRDEPDRGRNMPIVLFLRHYLPLLFSRKIPVGGYVSSSDWHRGGRSADIMLNAHKPEEKEIGDRLFNMFMDWGDELGVEYAIWNRKIWISGKDQSRQPRPYTQGKPHDDHIHVTFELEASKQPRYAWLIYLLQLYK